MPPPKKVTRETYLRELPYRIIRQLANQLDVANALDKNWKGVASKVPSKRGGDRYNLATINVFDLELQRGRSPTMALINDWGTSNATVQDLVNILDDLEMYSSIDILLPDYKPKLPEPKPESESGPQTLHHQSPYTSYSPHKENEAAAASYTPSTAATVVAQGWSSHEDEVSSSTDGNQPCESSIGPVEQSNLPRIPQHGDHAKEYNYYDLHEMTNRFDEAPLSEGGRKIGEGGFGTVFMGFFSGNEACAVKRLKEEVLSDERMTKQFTAEHTTLAKLQHPNLVRLYGYSFNGPSYCLVFRYLVNGSLNARLACENGTEPLQWRTRVSIAQGAAQGICFLHKHNHIHRDIKSANILLDENYVAKIGDFGLVKHLPQIDGKTSTKTEMLIGSPVYMAPEAHLGQISTKMDAYSFGVVLLEIMTGWPVINNDWDNEDIITHVDYLTQEEQTDFIKLMDKRMEHNFGEETVRKMYECSSRLLEHKRRLRPELSMVLEELMGLQA